MNCPDCAAAMVNEVRHSVAIDRCTLCGGIWFDIEEIQKYCSALHPQPRFVPCDADFQKHTMGIEGPCPCCHEMGIEHGAVRGLSFQRCSWCGGIFLGGPQLKRLLTSKIGQVTAWPAKPGPENTSPRERETSPGDVAWLGFDLLELVAVLFAAILD